MKKIETFEELFEEIKKLYKNIEYTESIDDDSTHKSIYIPINNIEITSYLVLPSALAKYGVFLKYQDGRNNKIVNCVKDPNKILKLIKALKECQ